jgi:hypothetical protein
MCFFKINTNNGDTISKFYVPQQFSNSGYTIYDVLVLDNNDFVISYNNGGGNGSIVRRFTPSTNIVKWSNDYAGLDFSSKGLCLDDTNIVMAGYKGAANFFYDLYVRKITQSNTTLWSKTYKRNVFSKDGTLGVKTNSSNNYLIATHAAKPCIVVLNNNGDSLTTHSIESVQGSAVNHGKLTTLQKSNNGFLATGYINVNTSTPQGNIQAQGYFVYVKAKQFG